MEKDDAKKLEQLFNDYKLKCDEVLNQCRKIILSYSSNDLYHCKYSSVDIKVGELSIADVKTIVQDYKNELSKRDKDDTNVDVRQQMIKNNKYYPGNEYGKE